MSQVPSTSTTSPNFDAIFSAALKVYKKQTKKDIDSHPLATELKSCDSSSAILAVLRTQAETFDQSQSADEGLTKWLDPTVNVLFAFSATVGNGVGVVFPPANAIFTGIGVLLQAVKDVRASKDALIDLFGRMKCFFKRLEVYIKVRPTAAMIDIIVKIMVEVISILGIVTKEIRQGRTKKYLKKLFGLKDVEDALQRLDTLTQEEARMAAAEALTITRSIDDNVKGVDERLEGVDERVQSVDMKVEGIDDKVLSVDGKVQGVDDKVLSVDTKVQGVDKKVGSVIQGVVVAGVAIQQVSSQVSDLKRNELRKDLRKWISPPDPSVNYNVASGAHHEGTATWCTEGKTLAAWKTSGSLLWIHGKPGSGKSILSSAIIRDIKSISDAGSAFLAYFYFDFKDTAKQDARALLSSLLVQLSDQSNVFCDTLFSLYSACKQGSEQPTDDALAGCLKNVLTIIGQVPIYFIMDALDECPNDSGIPSSREKVLGLVKELVGLRHPSLRLCVTSRPEFDIHTMLLPLTTQQISLHDEIGQKQDIIDYITSVVRTDRRMKRWRDDDKAMVIEKLIAQADGMFRWVFCQLEVLKHCFPANLRQTLGELPKSLDETYKRILKEINNTKRVHAYRLLQCLVVALRPLRVEELAEMLALDLSAGVIPKFNANWRWEDQEEAVLSACSSLVSVVIDHGCRIVQFSHFSVKEFLTSTRLASCLEDVSQFHIPIEPSHAILAQACLGVLVCLDDSTNVKHTPLYKYSARYWNEHAQVGNVELQIKDAMDYFNDVLTRGDLPYSAPLCFAAWRGLHGLVERLVTKHPQQVNQVGCDHGTPLHASVYGGHLKVVQVLVAHGANINMRCTRHWTTLHLAFRVGQLKILEWLLNHGGDVNSRETHNLTLLHFAAASGKLKACRILLGHNAEVDCRDDEGSTPCLLASRHGRLDTVRLLLDYNADVHAYNNAGNTPLHFSAFHGHLEICRVLLEYNARVDSRNRSTPYFKSSESRVNPDIVQLFRDRNMDLHVPNGEGNTPLHFAASRGHLLTCQILLEHNAEVNSRNNGGSTPLLYASEGRLDIVRLLLDYNADVHASNHLGITSLHVSASRGLPEVCRMLIEHKADVNSRTHHGSTPLLLASEFGYANIGQLLLDHNADVYVCDGDGDTPLHCSALGGQIKVSLLLLRLNVEVNSKNNQGLTPLHQASMGWEEGSAGVVRLLLDYGADVQARDLSGRTAAEVARGSEQREIVQLLSKHAVE